MAIFYYNGTIGTYCLEENNNTLTHLWLGSRILPATDRQDVKETPLLREANAQLTAYFERRLKKFSLPLAPAGTTFQLKVWELLQQIPYGETTTYGQLAVRTGNPKASRAVGMANGRNPLPIFIPCHRVIGAGGKLTGYTGGLNIKQILLETETVVSAIKRK